jgi:hypothetical protein
MLERKFSLSATFACSQYTAKSDHSYENTAILNNNVLYTSVFLSIIMLSMFVT